VAEGKTRVGRRSFHSPCGDLGADRPAVMLGRQEQEGHIAHLSEERRLLACLARWIRKSNVRDELRQHVDGAAERVDAFPAGKTGSGCQN
jgi:hypothetical protein